MKQLPDSPNLLHLKKQAKDLLRAFERGDAAAFACVSEWLPSARGLDPGGLAKLQLRLHDAQSCVAREYGFDSWKQLKEQVEWLELERGGREALRRRWISLVYGEGYHATRPALAARALAAHPEVTQGDIYLACAVGDVGRIAEQIAQDAEWVRRPGGPLGMLPLIAVTHSGLLRVNACKQALRSAAEMLLDAGADVNGSWTSREYPDSPLSVLYGAAGRHHDVEMTRLLLARGANPNDNESLYHSVESADAGCTELLLQAGARVAGSNALAHALDYRQRPERVRLLLDYGQVGEKHVLHHAIRRGAPVEVIRWLLDAGADPTVVNKEGISAYRYALLFGQRETAELLRTQGAGEELRAEERFVAACAAGDEAEARELLASDPEMLHRLPEAALRQLPNMAAQGNLRAVQVMVRLGWPIAVQGGDWKASALNLAVFNGDAAMAGFLLEHGASWKERHGYNNNVRGTLSFSSVNAEVNGEEDEGDWPACARLLVEHGMPVPEENDFSEEINAYFEKLREGTTAV